MNASSPPLLPAVLATIVLLAIIGIGYVLIRLVRR